MNKIRLLELRAVSPVYKLILKKLLLELLEQELQADLTIQESDQKALTGGYTFQQILSDDSLRERLAKEHHIKLGLSLYPVLNKEDIEKEDPVKTSMWVELDENLKPTKIWWE